MFAVKQKMGNGKIKWYLRYRNEKGQLVYYPKEKYPDFWTKREAEEWINMNRHRLTTIKKQAEIYKQIMLKKNFPEFQELLNKFIKTQKREAPNSWQSSETYMERYVMNYFLYERGIRDINEWYRYFEQFIEYLDKEATVLGTDKIIEYSTKNHIIRTLNKFLTVMARYHILDMPNPPKCRPFPKHLLNTRGYEDVILPDEYFRIRDQLEYSKEFFVLLYNTGMRFNELYSLHIDSIFFEDEIEESLAKKFEVFNVKIFGYISLEDQLDGKTKTEAKRKAKKDKDCKTLYKRKPLKSCKKIEPKNTRTIPIIDKETWNIIVENYNKRCDEFENCHGEGDNPKDYFLLDVEVNQLRREFRKVTNGKKGYHCCRHSYITRLAGEYNSDIARIVTAHRSEAFEAYNHIYQKIAQENSKKRKRIRSNHKGRRRLKKVA